MIVKIYIDLVFLIYFVYQYHKHASDVWKKAIWSDWEMVAALTHTFQWTAQLRRYLVSLYIFDT